jgi:hypothetical protein
VGASPLLVDVSSCFGRREPPGDVYVGYSVFVDSWRTPGVLPRDATQSSWDLDNSSTWVYV